MDCEKARDLGLEWKDNVENRGIRENMNKTKVMISGERQKVMPH